jgi:hypothetical protein
MPEGKYFQPVSHFGSGIVTLHTGYLFETEPGFNMLVSGPPNHRKHGIVPLTGIIETDWSPYTFTMNWAFTDPGVTVRFEAGAPFCTFYPVERGSLEKFEPEIRPLEAAPENKISTKFGINHGTNLLLNCQRKAQKQTMSAGKKITTEA